MCTLAHSTIIPRVCIGNVVINNVPNCFIISQLWQGHYRFFCHIFGQNFYFPPKVLNAAANDMEFNSFVKQKTWLRYSIYMYTIFHTVIYNSYATKLRTCYKFICKNLIIILSNLRNLEWQNASFTF